MTLRMFLVYTEPSTTMIGEAGFKQLVNIVSFRLADTIFPRKKMYFSATGRYCSKRYLWRKTEISMLYFSPNSLLTLHRINVIKGKTSTSYLSRSWHATCVVASNLRSPEFGCITYAEGIHAELLEAMDFEVLKKNLAQVQTQLIELLFFINLFISYIVIFI